MLLRSVALMATGHLSCTPSPQAHAGAPAKASHGKEATAQQFFKKFKNVCTEAFTISLRAHHASA